ncbi:MAG: glutathione S-transferase [Pseudomonadota bacterium]
MTYEIALGNRAYSSWSLRAWLLFERFDVPRQTTWVDFGDPKGTETQLIDFAPARTVPAMRTETGAVLSESLAIAEHLAEQHPHIGIWPSDPFIRAIARNLAAEMHSGFTALRTDCPMNLYVAYEGVDITRAVQDDLHRLERIWQEARDATQSDTLWLCGPYSAADAFFAPVAARIAGYGLEVSYGARSYVDAHLSDRAFRRWRAMAIANGKLLKRYERDYATRAWPGPTPRPARAVDATQSENMRCPYSGDPVTHFLEMDGRVFGFCNAFCLDKTLADPDAWPDFIALLDNVTAASPR